MHDIPLALGKVVALIAGRYSAVLRPSSPISHKTNASDTFSLPHPLAYLIAMVHPELLRLPRTDSRTSIPTLRLRLDVKIRSNPYKDQDNINIAFALPLTSGSRAWVDGGRTTSFLHPSTCGDTPAGERIRECDEFGFPPSFSGWTGSHPHKIARLNADWPAKYVPSPTVLRTAYRILTSPPPC